MKKKVYLWSTIYERLMLKGVQAFDIDIRYLGKWMQQFPECFPKFMLQGDYTAKFNWELVRWEIQKH